jgi:hypothetical protein
MVYNANFNNISVMLCRSVLLVEETEYPKKTTDLSQVTNKVVLSTPRLIGIQSHNVSGDRH